MEASSDVFEQGGVEIGEGDDPFAGTDFDDPFAEGQAEALTPDEKGETEASATADLPVVNKEGEPVQPQAEPAPAAPAPTPPPGPSDPAAEGAAYAEHHGTPPAQPQAAPPAESAPVAAPPAAQEPASPAPEPPAAPAPAAESAPQTAPVPEPETAPVPPTATATPPAASAGPTDEAPVPDEPRGKSGRVTARRYYLLRVTGPGKFEQLQWHEDKDGKMVAKGTPGSKRQTIALARDTEHALKIGYVICGRPQDGVTLVAVAAAHFQAKPVKPKPPEPTRERLQIG